jgi:hypothetical protein
MENKMFAGISKNIISAMPTVSTGCFVVAGAVAGRKVASAGVCKAGAVVLGLMGKPNAEWNKSSHDYLTQAKKDAFKDLTKAAGFALAGFGAKYAGEALKELPKVVPTTFEQVVGFASEHFGAISAVTSLVVTIGSGALLLRNVKSQLGGGNF